MKNNNSLNTFDPGSYSKGFDDVVILEGECPGFTKTFTNPLKLVDYIGCHKILLAIIIALIAFVLYSGAKAKAKAEDAAGSGKGADAAKK